MLEHGMQGYTNCVQEVMTLRFIAVTYSNYRYMRENTRRLWRLRVEFLMELTVKSCLNLCVPVMSGADLLAHQVLTLHAFTEWRKRP